ncbi:divalent-cation tolerance protein CutA [bacterium (Candidatus Blackallbacteria) CG17_big_fil_post_rev_8_21_14_2_50_48_46]|uniref:Divalent-cation tolerance protein CutA n=1 Tax=bacterium (Candidatus Blackallbacteria) CG17_big_fil_post_rev_8_21_14_2_50_48_46 TaxID=2014261 RepID=A0A2M7G0U3_9BACT|nr:MAG: divalent-cation tolerance protein CutA [bacterium (Candidatus Blackallbacteria) CG18_big_fil_WC_8_21_14_2_50_49_26]PIW15338.1 MAG: divalent-cation tolerance protein CutA [bacterium (Candidatus Blackallbacteria) CG17_big_fil_post_rev_8_21_14_2_50_48_46]PIW49801.1 MAG: divalent-cation tolerance protein CutA [bacterium (Candidatus Blackallbacteria) CG13_big_fil_rev_8_21_14_2_50_49_14]
MTEYCVVYITAGSLEQAQQLADALVQENLAACVNRVGPVHSTYRWMGQICNDEEYLLIIKTRQKCLPELTQRVQALHSYEVPEIIALPILGGLTAYLDWIQAQTEEPAENE